MKFGKALRLAGWLATLALVGAALLAPVTATANTGNNGGDWQQFCASPSASPAAPAHNTGAGKGDWWWCNTCPSASASPSADHGTNTRDRHFDWCWVPKTCASASASTTTHGIQAGKWFWFGHWSWCRPDPCATAAPKNATTLDHHDKVCPTPTPVPTPTPTDPPTAVPTVVAPTPVPTPSGNVGGETGNPNITPPPTDGVQAVAAVARSWTTLLLALAGLLASVLILTPMAIRRRR